MDNVNHGQRNLILLGAGALLITGVTTAFSLWVYRSSGDIYLDRSRPGYLPDKEEANEVTNNDGGFVFSDTGELNKAELEKYLEELKKIDERLDALADSYAPGPLSDASLGITEEANPNEAKDKK